jgi:hypothetical protein
MKKSLFSIFFVFIFLAFLAGNLRGAEFCINSESSLQASLTDAEANGEDDVIKVLQGSYHGNFEHFSMEGKNITLLGGYTSNCSNRILNPANTIFDGEGLDTVLSIITTSGGSIFIEGFTIQNGKTSFGGSGGGINASSSSFSSGSAGDVSITNNIVTGNSAHGGGGISATSRSLDDVSGNVTISNNTISNNTAHVAGGISASSWTSSEKGGDVILAGNTIEGNTAEAGAGGAHVAAQSSNSAIDGDITVENNTVKENAGGTVGGGIFVQSGLLSGENPGGKVSIFNNKILQNSAYAGGGGGICITSYSSGVSGNIKLYNNIIAGNSSGGGLGGGVSVGPTHVYAERDVILTNNTITDNTADGGGGVYFSFSQEGYKAIHLFNNIIWGNVDGGDITIFGTGTVNGYSNDYSDINGSWTESGNNINRSPMFVDAINGDYHLKPFSPCIEKGTNDALGIPDTDFEEDPRIYDADNDGTAMVDIGADEFIGQARASHLPFLQLLLDE